MCEVVIQSVEPVFTREGTERMVKNIDITYAKADVEHPSNNATHMNDKYINQLLGPLNYFCDLFDGTLGN